MIIKQSTAVILKVGPFVDDTDGKTAEVGLTIAQADIQISKNGAAFGPTSDGAPTTTHDADGWYPVPLTTTDTGTLGKIVVQVSISGALPVWREYDVVPANVYDSMIAGTDVLQADVTQLGGVAQSATDLKDFADAGYDPGTNKVQGVVLVDTTTVNTDMVGTDASALAAVCTEARLAELDAANIPTDAGRLTAARAQVLDDWVNAGRLDAILDIIAVDVAGLNGDVMRGTDSAALAATLTGITSLAEWLGLLAGKQAGDATALTELKATGAGSGTYDPTTDAVEALRDRGDAAWPTATGFSTHDAAAVLAAIQAAGTHLTLIKAVTDLFAFTGNDVKATLDGEEVVTDAASRTASKADVSLLALEATVAALVTDTISEIAQGVPPANPTLLEALMLPYMRLRNKAFIEATEMAIHNDAGTKIAKKVLSDDGTTFNEAEMISGA